MNDAKQREIFSRNLAKQLRKRGITQKELADAIGITPTSVNNWLQKVSLPRMGKVQMIADYLGIQNSDLLNEKTMSYNVAPIDEDRQLILEKIEDFTPKQLARLTAYADFIKLEGK